MTKEPVEYNEKKVDHSFVYLMMDSECDDIIIIESDTRVV